MGRVRGPQRTAPCTTVQCEGGTLQAQTCNSNQGHSFPTQAHGDLLNAASPHSFFLKAVISSSLINQTSLFLLNSCSPDQKDLGVLFWNMVTCSRRNFPACSVPSKPSTHPVSSCSLGIGWFQPIGWSLASFSPGLVLCRVCCVLPLCGVRSSKQPLNCPSCAWLFVHLP